MTHALSVSTRGLSLLCLFTLCGASAAHAQAITPSGPYLLDIGANPRYGEPLEIIDNFIIGYTETGSNYAYQDVVWQIGATCSEPVPVDGADDLNGGVTSGHLYGMESSGLVGYWDPANPSNPPTTVNSNLYGGVTAATPDNSLLFGFPQDSYLNSGSWFYDATNPGAGAQILGVNAVTGDAFGVVSVTGGRALADNGRVYYYEQGDAIGYWDLSNPSSLSGPPTLLPDPDWAVPGSCYYGYGGTQGTSDGTLILATCSVSALSNPSNYQFVNQSFVWDMTNPSAPAMIALGGSDTESYITAIAMNDQYIIGSGTNVNNTGDLLVWSSSDPSAAPIVLPETPASAQQGANVNGLYGNIVMGSTYSPGIGGEVPLFWDLSGAADCTNNPVANAGPAQTIYLDPLSGQGVAQLDGTASTGAVSWTWYSEYSEIIATGPTPTIAIPYEYSFPIWLVVTNAAGLTSQSEVMVTGVYPPCPVGFAYSPALGEQGMMMFEDLWPYNGDLDFNDEVVTYNYQLGLDGSNNVLSIEATFSVLAIGATIHNGLYLHLPGVTASQVTGIQISQNNVQYGASVAPVAGESELVIPIVEDTRSGGFTSTGFINTEANLSTQAPATSTFSVQIDFAAPLSLNFGAGPDLSAVPFDLFIARTGDYPHQIHQPQYSGTDLMDTTLFGSGDDGSNTGINVGRNFVNTSGLPFALTLPQTIAWPLETVSISTAYPDIVGFGTSGGQNNADWYTSDVVSSSTFGNELTILLGTTQFGLEEGSCTSGP